MPRDRHGEKEKKKRRKRDLPNIIISAHMVSFSFFSKKNSGTGFPKIYFLAISTKSINSFNIY